MRDVRYYSPPNDEELDEWCRQGVTKTTLRLVRPGEVNVDEHGQLDERGQLVLYVEDYDGLIDDIEDGLLPPDFWSKFCDDMHAEVVDETFKAFNKTRLSIKAGLGKINAGKTFDAETRQEHGRKLWLAQPGISGELLRRAYEQDGCSVSVRTAQNDLKKYKGSRN